MPRISVSLLAAFALTLAGSAMADDAGHAPPRAMASLARSDAASGLLDRLQRLAPQANPRVLALALEAAQCAAATGAIEAAHRLAVIDYSLPSTEPRLWVFDLGGVHLEQARLLYVEYVAHGKGSGENFANAFSNRESSHQSSLGLFATAETYTGGNGYSLRMDGLEPGINDQARTRAIVMHGAPYVDPAMARQQGRLGRSYGCPALRPAIASAVIDTLKQGQLVFAYYPDQEWLTHSRFFRCAAKRMAGIQQSRSSAVP